MTRNLILIAVGAVVAYWLATAVSSTPLAIFMAAVALVFAFGGPVARWAVLILMPPWSFSWRFPDDSRIALWKLKMLTIVGRAEAYCYLGEYYERNGKRAESLNCYLRGAQKGDADAQCALGKLYENGEVVQDPFGEPAGRAESKRARSDPMPLGDFIRAEEWFHKAADQGDVLAMYHLGQLHLSDKDPVSAAPWLLKNADHGGVVSQLHVAKMFREGEGMPKDLVSAYMWANLAAARVDHGTNAEEARSIRDEIEGQMTPGQIAEGQRLAREWKAKPSR